MPHVRPSLFIPSNDVHSVNCPTNKAKEVMEYLRLRGKVLDSWPLAGFNTLIRFQGNLDIRQLIERFPEVKHEV